MDAALHERRRMNDDIEGTYLLVIDICSDIDTYKNTERGMTALALYEAFYKQFNRLILLTRNPLKLKKRDDVLDAADKWIKMKSVASRDDSVILSRCQEGVEVFRKYQDALWEKGVLSLPTR